MQDVKRGEVALWVVCSDREGHSKAWPAVRMQGRGLRATFLLRFLSLFEAFSYLWPPSSTFYKLLQIEQMSPCIHQYAYPYVYAYMCTLKNSGQRRYLLLDSGHQLRIVVLDGLNTFRGMAFQVGT